MYKTILFLQVEKKRLEDASVSTSLAQSGGPGLDSGVSLNSSSISLEVKGKDGDW